MESVVECFLFYVLYAGGYECSDVGGCTRPLPTIEGDGKGRFDMIFISLASIFDYCALGRNSLFVLRVMNRK